MKKVVFLDIDGTLVEPGSNVPPESALLAIRKAQEKGNYVYLCTGRNPAMLSPLLKYGFDGFIGSAGGYVVCGKEVIFDCPMTKEQFEVVLHALREEGVFFTIETRDGAYTDEGFKEFLEKNAAAGSNSELLRWRRQIEQSLNILPFAAYDGSPVYKFIVMCFEEKQLEKARMAAEQDFLFCIQPPDKFGYVNGELINRRFDKGQAVFRVCEYLNIPIFNSIGYGDSINDKEMLETVGHGVCMENGSRELKALADEICPAVLEDGIYKSFEKNKLF